MQIWDPKPPGTLWVTPDLLRGCFTDIVSLREFTCSVLRQKFKASNFRCLWTGDVIYIESDVNVVVVNTVREI